MTFFDQLFSYFSESFGIGLTTEDIVDRLLSTEYSKTDENIIPIFLTFFRKFMKPYELVKILVERFENDGLSEALPTDLQKRIHCIFSLWLSHYWNDFYGTQARKHIILFLDRISKYDSHTPICDSLAPLVVREPPTYDPDNVWGLVDDVQEEEPSTPIKRNEKKDSGYASGTFTFVPSSPTKSDAPPFTLKRLSSTTTQPPTLLSPNLNRILLRSHGKAVTHSGSHPDLKSSYAATSHHNTELPRRAEFAGGLINIDNATKQSYPPSSISRSLATTSGGRWTTSLGNQLLASSFISTFRQNKSEKDQAGHNYKLFIKASDTSIADQLTWIESELFSKIKSREFVRNIWNSPVNDNKRSSLLSCNNTVLASIAHFNFISAWVVTVIVTQSRLSKRVALLQKFMSIAVHLRNLNNYNTLMAILAGINSASVLRLKQTRQAILTKKIYKQFQSLEKLMSTDKSFSSYRMALKASSSGTPGIPYLGIHTQDLVSLAEANKDFRADGSIHWEKFRLMGETIMATMKFKCPSYTIEPDAKLLALIADTYILSEDDQYKMSTAVEPRLAPSSTNRIRDLWLRI
ncbi:ras guanine nucleotide exchange factor domain-containing protein [Helicostylum pulchrum]|nr:ras guanine nucleotide exchange factor domain-containing protein [Helicostylum pulchrum]